MSENSWIGVDLDRTLAHYDEWRGEEHIGAPIAPMVERVKAWLAEGREVRIVTARADSAVSVAAIQSWCLDHIGVALPVTASKDYLMVEIWDDRAVQVEPNTGLLLGESKLSVTPLKELERREIAKALKVTNGSVIKAAKLLGMGKATLYRRLDAEKAKEVFEHETTGGEPTR
jgi:DNA-binding NtrC family response regulator